MDSKSTALATLTEDIARAATIPLNSCPRKYCWWWKSLKFEWDISLAQGCECQFLCGRKDLGALDQYEPREPHLEEDGFHRYRFCGPRNSVPY